MSRNRRRRAGGWLFHDRKNIDIWVRDLKRRAAANPQPLVPPIQELKNLVEQDPVLNFTVEAMFKEAAILKQQTPLGTPEVKDFDEFLVLLNEIMRTAPQYTECRNSDGVEEPCGLIGFPINALLDWPMATSFGYEVFSNQLINQQFKKILGYWSKFLVRDDSRYVLVDSFPNQTPKALAWLSPTARQEMVDVACQASGCPDECKNQPFEYFFNCDPSDPYYGFKSWDDFFTRTFRDEVRPVAEGDDIVANACESAPLQVATNVSETAEFWLKGQPYSLQDMMNFDPLAEQFAGGTIYQAFLSALSYHRWNSPVTGTVKKAFVVNGSYYLENRYQGFINPDGGDPSAPNDSQPFLTAVATRAVIFIEADNPKIGLMCFIAVGMAEVSSCEITVSEGERIEKGQELGMFHFGGSTHCLIFRPEVQLEFDFHNTTPGLDATNIPVRSQIAKVVS
ncbi:MAG: phosphatidylserine decarboxylase family protein [Planctomycetaceae bacterium]|nr:phosphatidylserine decarboxylase family protein [Planctomycetaceae bacterium]MCB9951899.1 phosphatidylserine decarboxylase family protein [Planctomycetaceae bacterium]